MIACKNCGKEYPKQDSNCCWITCECGESICGTCGGSNIVNMNMPDDDDEAQYWCCSQCADCGLQGCAMCI